MGNYYLDIETTGINPETRYPTRIKLYQFLRNFHEGLNQNSRLKIFQKRDLLKQSIVI